MLDALSFLHNKNIVHRDLKPQNILFDKDKKHAKICDLGMSKFVSLEEIELPRISVRSVSEGQYGGALAQTPGYKIMPPEVIQIQVGEQYEPKYWDIFSIGMIIYFMCVNIKTSVAR